MTAQSLFQSPITHHRLHQGAHKYLIILNKHADHQVFFLKLLLEQHDHHQNKPRDKERRLNLNKIGHHQGLAEPRAAPQNAPVQIHQFQPKPN